MISSIALVSMAGILAGANIPLIPTWEQDYAAARKQVEISHKPLVVVIAAGEKGWQELTPEGTLSQPVQKSLSANYICLYFNLQTRLGHQAAETLGLAGQPGLVISDRTGQFLAFRHSGQLTQEELARRLERYSSREHVVTATESAEPTASGGAAGFGECPNCRRY